ncbi:MAG: hypothetical protein WA208_07880 [Thermoanaerobaculia bacterium]
MRRSWIRWFPILCVASVSIAGCATGLQPFPDAWVAEAPADIRSVRFAADGTVLPSDVDRPGRLADGAATLTPLEGGVAIAHAGTAVSPRFAAVDSLDLSETRQEIVFSAQREGDFDIGLVATSGGDVTWLPDDPTDEVAVQWAPRGHKVSYVIRAPGGDVIRTLHIPTSFQFSIDFPWAHVTDVAWDAAAERLAVVLSSPDASACVEVVRYEGTERRVAVKPRVTTRLTVEPLAGGLLLRPSDLAYDARLPLVVWESPVVNEWSAARAALVQESRVACLVLPVATAAAVETAMQMPWVDREHVFTVGAAKSLPSSVPVTAIVGSEAVPAGRYLREGAVVSVSPAVVQSFAAAFIAEQLKRTSPPNGSSR